MTQLNNLPLGCTARAISPPFVCAKCEQEIAAHEPVYVMADEVWYDCVYCESCAENRAELN